MMGLSGVCLGLGLLLPRRARVATFATLAGTLLAAAGMVLGVVWIVVRLLPGRSAWQEPGGDEFQNSTFAYATPIDKPHN